MWTEPKQSSFGCIFVKKNPVQILKEKGTTKLFELLSYSVTIRSKCNFSFTQGEWGSSVVSWLQSLPATPEGHGLNYTEANSSFFFFSFIRDFHKLSTRRMIHVLTTNIIFHSP